MKNGTLKKLLALVLVTTLILSLGLTTAFAEGEGPTGEAENTFLEVYATDTQDGVTVNAEVPSGQTVDVAVSEDNHTVTVDAGQGDSSHDSASAQSDNVTVEVNINVSGEGSTHSSYVDNGVGVYVEGSTSETAPQVTVDLNDHNVSASGSDGIVTGIYADGNNVTVTGAGEVSAAVSGPDSSAVAIDTTDGATVEAKSAEAEGYEATAVRASGDGSHVEAGSATATGVNTATAVDAGFRADVKVETAVAETKEDNSDSTATAIQAQCGSNVEANSATARTVNGTAQGITVIEDGASVTVGSVVAESENGDAIAITVSVSDGQELTPFVSVEKDVESSDTGILVEGGGDAKAIVEVGDTLKVAEGGTPVLLGSGVTEDNIEITVWKVEIDGQQAKEGEIIKPNADGEATDEQKAAAKAVEESIQYIIRIDPQQTDNIKSSKDKAKANETFTITVTPPEGKKLDKIYSDTDEIFEAVPNDDGTYSVTVRVGGGMYLKAKFSDKPVDPTPKPEPAPVPVDPKPAPAPVDPKPQPAPAPAPEPAPVPVPVAPSVDTSTAVANDWAAATVKLTPENGAYTLTLTTRVPTMTFLRQTLEKFAKYNDTLYISTPYGSCAISLSELLNFNVKAVNFRIGITGSALEIYVNGELYQSIFVLDLMT